MGEVNYTIFTLKYIFRFIHIFSFAMLFGNISYDLFVKRRTTSTETYRNTHLALDILFYVLIIVSGLVNMVLLIIEKKFNRDFYYEVWKKSLIVKFILTIFLTPLLEALISIGEKDKEKIDSIALPIKFSFMLVFTLYSCFLRFFREYYMTTPQESYIK